MVAQVSQPHISEQKAVMEGLWLSQLSDTSAPHTSTSHHTLRAEKLYSLSLRQCPALVPVTPPVRWRRMWGDTWSWGKKSEQPARAAARAGVRKPKGGAALGRGKTPALGQRAPFQLLYLLSRSWWSWAEHLTSLSTGWLLSKAWSAGFPGLVLQL